MMGRCWLQGCVPLADARVRLEWKGSLTWKSLNPSAGGVGAPGVGQDDAAMGDGQLEWARLLVPQPRTCLSLPLGRRSASPAGPMKACPLRVLHDSEAPALLTLAAVCEGDCHSPPCSVCLLQVPTKPCFSNQWRNQLCLPGTRAEQLMGKQKIPGPS